MPDGRVSPVKCSQEHITGNVATSSPHSQYGWKVGRSDGAFTRRLRGNFVSRGLHPSIVHLAACSVVSPFRVGYAVH